MAPGRLSPSHPRDPRYRYGTGPYRNTFPARILFFGSLTGDGPRSVGLGVGRVAQSPVADPDDPQLAVDLPESGSFGEASEVTIVEAGLGARGLRLEAGVEQPDLVGDGGALHGRNGASVRIS